MTGPTLTAGTVPVGPMLSMFDPIYVGIDEFGHPVYIRVIYKNLLAAGQPGGGKSGLMNTLTAHAALSARSRLVLFDGKQVELGMWDDIADEFVGPDLDHAIITLRRLQRVMDNRYAWLTAHRRREIRPGDGITVITIVIDEIALFSTVLGTKAQQEEFITLFRDLVARGRAAAMPVIAATQRPSVDIIPKSLRDLFGYRAAFRCTSTGSCDIILGDNLSAAGFTATDIAPSNPGECQLIAEGGIPERIKVSYLSDADIIALADYAAWTRRTGSLPPPQARPPPSPDRHPPKGTVMSLTTDPDARQAFITGLRDLADYLDRHPAVPVPADGTEILLSAASTDDGGCAQVDRFARQLGVPVANETGLLRPLRAARSFGPVGYRMTAISEPRWPATTPPTPTTATVTPDTWT